MKFLLKIKKTPKWLIFLMFQVASWTLMLSPWKYRIQSFIYPDKDKLVAVAEGDLDGLGNKVKVLKFKSKHGMRIEFLKGNSKNKAIQFLNQNTLDHPYNGYFLYRNRTIQLGIVDMDGDGVMEVVAPSFDRNLIAHLNVYKYNQAQDKFFKYESY